jgi:hypothetical protein
MGETMKNDNFLLTSNYLLENDKIDNKEINELFYTYLNKINISLSTDAEKNSKKTLLVDIKNVLIDNKDVSIDDKTKEDETQLLDKNIKNVDEEISHLNNDKIDQEKLDLQKIYIFGILPIELMPSSYIPLNYKNYSRNLSRITKDDSFTDVDYEKVISPYESTKYDEEIAEKLKNILIYLKSDDSLHNMFNLNIFAIYIIIIWSFVIIMFMCILYYYYSEINYIFACIVISYLFIAIIWKMIYTIQN